MNGLEATLLKNTVDIIGAANGTARRLIGLLDEAERRSFRRIQTRMADLSVSDLSITRERRLLQEIAGTLSGMDGQFESIVGEARAEVVRADYLSVSRALAEETDLPASAVPSRIPVRQVEAILARPILGRTLAQWTERMPRRLMRGIQDELAQARIRGEGVWEVAHRLRYQFNMSRRGATVLSRTALLQASADARNAVYDEHADVIDSYTWLATLDERTCLQCAALDGATETKREDFPESPPIHPQDRCFIRANIKGMERPERPVVRESERHTTRHTEPYRKDDGTMGRRPDGSTSTRWRPTRVTRERITFNRFFRTQPAEWQRRYLGPRRYEMWRNGKVRLGGFSANNHILTLDELRASAGASA